MSTWDFRHQHVQQFDSNEIASQIGSKSVLISVGPPNFDPEGQSVVVGMVQNLSMQQQRQIMEIFEIGSQRRYYADNPHRNMLQMSRILFSGPSFMKLLASGILNQGVMPGPNPRGVNQFAGLFEAGNRNAVGSNPNGQFFINLASDVFNNPLGVMLQFRESRGHGGSVDYGSIYCEVAKVQGHNMAMNSQMWMIQEDVSILFENVVPLAGGLSVQESLAGRKAIMDSLNITPEWYNDFASWNGGFNTTPVAST